MAEAGRRREEARRGKRKQGCAVVKEIQTKSAQEKKRDVSRDVSREMKIEEREIYPKDAEERASERAKGATASP